MVSDVTVTSSAVDAARTQEQAVTLGDDFADFLTLLTTQLQNQDPLSPLDSNQFTEQLVQFSQVEQAINTNSKLDDLVTLQLNSATSTSLGYVGLDVSYVSAEVAYDGQNATEIRYSLDRTAATAKINIYDENGALVFSGDAEREPGVHVFEWQALDQFNQPLPEGTYTVSVDALDAEDAVIDTTTVVKGRVKGIEQQDGIPYVLIGDRAVAVASILSATVPEEAPEEEDITAPTSGGSGGTTI